MDDPDESIRFPIRRGLFWSPFLMLLAGARAKNAYIELTRDRLRIRFGWWGRIDTLLDDVKGATARPHDPALMRVRLHDIEPLIDLWKGLYKAVYGEGSYVIVTFKTSKRLSLVRYRAFWFGVDEAPRLVRTLKQRGQRFLERASRHSLEQQQPDMIRSDG